MGSGICGLWFVDWGLGQVFKVQGLGLTSAARAYSLGDARAPQLPDHLRTTRERERERELSTEVVERLKDSGTSLIRTPPPPKITIGPQAQGYCRVLQGGGFV